MQKAIKDKQYYKFCLYGFFKNLRFFEPFFMLFFIEKGISFFQIGTLYAIREISILILEIPTGLFADLLGRRKTMIVSFLAYIIAFIFFYISSSYLILTIAMLIFSMGDAMRTGTHKAMIFDYLKLNNWQTDKLEYYGHTRSWSQIGSAISSILAAIFVIITGNYTSIFLISTLPYIADLLLMTSYPKTLEGPLKTNKTELTFRLKDYTSQIKLALKRKSNWRIFIHLSSFQGLFKSVKDYLQPIIVIAVANTYPSNHKNESITIGIIYFIIYIISSIVSRKSKQITSKFKNNVQALNLTLFIGITAGLISGIFSLSEFYCISIVMFIVFFIIQNLRKPLGSALIADELSQDILASGLSVQSLFDSLLTATYAIILGALADVYSIDISIMILSITLLIIFPLIRLIPVEFRNASL